MRFVVRQGSDPVAEAPPALLAALGLPAGGVLRMGAPGRVGLVAVRPSADVAANDLRLGPRTAAARGVTPGDVVDAERAVAAPAEVVVVEVLEDVDDADVAAAVAGSLRGLPVNEGDEVRVDLAYGGRPGAETVARVLGVRPGGAALVGSSTRIRLADGPEPAPTPTTDDAHVPQASDRRIAASGDADAPATVGLEKERQALRGWFRLLAGDAPGRAPDVAGIVAEGPEGCGRAELVRAAAEDVGLEVLPVRVDMVFKAGSLLDRLSKALHAAGERTVILVEPLEAVLGEDALGGFRDQAAAIFRWFLDAVAERPGVLTVVGVDSRADLPDGLLNAGLLPWTVTIPPPDAARRRALFAAALGPDADRFDLARLADRSAGFSAADVEAAVLNARARAAAVDRRIEAEDLDAALAETIPSLGATSLGRIPSYGFEKVADLTEVKRRLEEAVIWPLRDPARYAAMGLGGPRGVLLHGPPGTGKTFVVRALAHEAGAAFFPVKGAELLDRFVGESERGVRELFARARAAAPALVFFDEFDALAPVRGRSTTNVTDSVVATLLTELDGIVDRGRLAVVAATNRPDLVDPALLRPGRFEVHLELGLPVLAARRAMLEMSDVPFDDDVDLDRLAAQTEGFSFADLAGLLREAALVALRTHPETTAVGEADIAAALDRWRARVGGGAD